MTKLETLISKDVLSNNKLILGHWYTKKQAWLLGLLDSLKSNYLTPMGDPFCEVTEFLLQQGINNYFPNTNPETELDDQFFVHLKDFGSTTYVVIDENFNLTREIDCSQLEDPTFYLVGWHLNYVIENELFYKHYGELHEQQYQPFSDEEIDKYINMPGLICNAEGEVLDRITHTLGKCQPYPGDGVTVDQTYLQGGLFYCRKGR